MVCSVQRTALDLAIEIGMVRISENLVTYCRMSEGCKNHQLVEGIAGFRVASFVKDLDSILDPCIQEHNPSQKMTRLHPTQAWIGGLDLSNLDRQSHE